MQPQPDRRLSEFAELRARTLCGAGVAETVKPRYYVMGYYSITRVNPTGIIPKGTPVDFKKPHDRARFAA